MIPYQPQNLTSEQADGNILLNWQASLGATSYTLQRSTDNVNFSTLSTLGQVTQYQDSLPGIGIQYYYKIAAVNSDGTSPYSSVTTAIAAPPSEMSLYELRLRAQQTADRVGSQFITTTEWNAFLRIAMYELYDLLIGSYEDYFAQNLVYITTNGSQQYYPLPDGVTNYPGGNYSASTVFTFTISSASASINAVYSNNGYQFTVSSTISSGTTLSVTGTGTPLPNGILTKVSGTGDSEITFQSYSITLSGQPASAFYKMAGMDLAVNTSTVNPAWVTLKKYNFIDRNKYVYPNSTSTIYGVYNQAYRIMGQQLQFIPVPAGNQTIRMWYAPRLPALLKDTDLTTLGFSGWLRYPIVRAAKYALDKEEGSDTSKLDTEIVFLKQRIQEMASNRDAGMPDTISDTRREGLYGGGPGGPGWPNAGWAALLFFPSLFENYITNTSLVDSVFVCQFLLTIFACGVLFSNRINHIPSYFGRIIRFSRIRFKMFCDIIVSSLSPHIETVVEGSSEK